MDRDRWEIAIGTVANIILWENEARHIATDCDAQFVGELFSHAHQDSIRYHQGRETILRSRPLPGQRKCWERKISANLLMDVFIVFREEGGHTPFPGPNHCGSRGDTLVAEVRATKSNTAARLRRGYGDFISAWTQLPRVQSCSRLSKRIMFVCIGFHSKLTVSSQ